MTKLRIKEICKEKGMSINALADAIGIQQPSLSRIISGNQKPSFDTLEKIAEALRVDMYELFRPSGETKGFSCPHCGKVIEISIK